MKKKMGLEGDSTTKYTSKQSKSDTVITPGAERESSFGPKNAPVPIVTG